MVFRSEFYYIGVWVYSRPVHVGMTRLLLCLVELGSDTQAHVMQHPFTKKIDDPQLGGCLSYEDPMGISQTVDTSGGVIK